jgi:serine/threonine-protein kinase
MIAEIESNSSLAASASDGQKHVMSVLNAKNTLGPSHEPNAGGQMMTAVTQTMEGATPISAASSRSSVSYVPHVDGPPVTQPSSISVSSPTPGLESRGKGGQRAIVALASGMLLGLVLLASGLLYMKHRAAAADALVVGPTGTSSGPTGLVEADAGPLAVTTATTTTATATASAEPEPTATATATAAATTTATAKKAAIGTGVKKVAPPPPPPPPPTPAADCNPGYWFDAQGVKHYKPQCLGKN